MSLKDQHYIHALINVLSWSCLIVTLLSVFWLQYPINFGDDARFLTQSLSQHSSTIIPIHWHTTLLSLKTLKIAPTAQQQIFINVNYNAPLFKWFWTKLMTLPPSWQAPIWFNLNIFGFITGYTLIYYSFFRQQHFCFPLILSGLFILSASLNNLSIGQVGGIVTLIVGLLFYCQHRQFKKCFLVLVSLSVAFKYFFALLWLHWLRHKQWRYLSLSGFITASFIAIPYLALSPVTSGLNLLPNLAVALLAKAQLLLNSSVLGFLARLFNHYSVLTIYMMYFVGLITITAILLTTKHPNLSDKNPMGTPTQLALYLGLAFSFAPLGWSYYSACLWPLVIILLYYEQHFLTRATTFLAIALYCMPSQFDIIVTQNTTLNTPKLIWYAFVPTVLQILLIYTVWQKSKYTERPSEFNYISGAILILTPWLSWLPLF